MAGCGDQGESRPESVASDEGRVRVNGRELILAPASEDEARVAALLPTKPSEDASHVLKPIELKEPEPGLEREYLPADAVDWVVTVEFPGDPRLSPADVEGLFDRGWRERFGGFTLYGRDADTGRWTFAVAKDGPKAITRLKFAWDYVPFGDDDPRPTAALFEQRLGEVTRKLGRFGEPNVGPSLPPAEAERRATELAAFKSHFGGIDGDVVLVLKAPSGETFDGKAVWDVMLSLGLEWGDMDCFHWVNPSAEGDSFFFSVQTSTPPGYFLPEAIAADEVHVEDLVFIFSIPRSAKPLDVFDSMTRAVEYSRKRLSGRIGDGSGNEADLAAIRRRIEDYVRRLRDAGFEAGRDDVLRLL